MTWENTRPDTQRMLIVHPDGTAYEAHSPNDDYKSLEALYNFIGCQIVDLVSLDDFDMWINANGSLGAEINGPASYIARRISGMRRPYYGIAVFSGRGNEDRRTVGLTDEQYARLIGLLGELADTLTIEAELG